MTSIWHQNPLVRVAIAFMAGLVFARFSPFINAFEVWIPVLFILVLATFVMARKQWKKYKFRYLSGVLLAMAFAIGGVLISNMHTRLFSPDQLTNQRAYWLCELEDYPSSSARSIKLELKVLGFYLDSDTLITIESGLLGYAKLNSGLDTLVPGDHIAFRSTVTQFDAPINPGQFDYGAYLSKHGIVGMVFLNEDAKAYRLANQRFSLDYFFKKMQNSLVHVLSKYEMDPREYGVASALILGKRTLVEPDIKSDFADAGVVHILAVSGLHVGIIYLVLIWFFNAILKAARWKWLKLVMVIVLLWIYAGITGFSPSVMRAATMFSFVAIGQQLQKKGSIYNMLGVSALLLLLIQPNLLFEVGFQLSYIAVLGIAVFYPGFYALFIFENKWADKTWSLVVVSFSAQLATFPLAVYYFDQFPNYFLLSNLIIIPLATAGLYVGLLALLLSWIPWIDLFLLKLLEAIFWLLNSSVEILADLPMAKSEHLHIGAMAVVLIYSLIFFLFKFLESPMRWPVWWPLSLCFVLLFLFAKRKYDVFNTSELVILEGSKMPIPLIQKGENAWLLYEGSQEDFESKEGFYLDGYFTEKGIITYKLLNEADSINQVGFRLEGNIWHLEMPFNSNRNLEFDAIEIVGAANRIPPTSRNLVIVNSQVSSYARSSIVENLEAANKPYWDMKSRGIFSLQLQY